MTALGFTRISDEDYREYMLRQGSASRLRSVLAAISSNSSIDRSPKRRSVGRPKKIWDVNQGLALPVWDLTSASDPEEDESVECSSSKDKGKGPMYPTSQATSQASYKGKSPMDPSSSGSSSSQLQAERISNVSSSSRISSSNRPSSYTNWFALKKWPHIDTALGKTNFRVSETVNYLKRKFPATASGPGLFDKLNESTVRGWFERDGRTFKKKVRRAVDTLSPSTPAISLCRLTNFDHGNIWSQLPEVEEEFKTLLLHLRDQGQILNSVTCQVICKGLLQARAPSVLVEHGGTFQCSRSWVRFYLREVMKWSFREGTTNHTACPPNWRELGDIFLGRLAVLVRVHNIPSCLVINMDQTGMALVPCSGERTYALKGVKEAGISGKDDKRSITVVPSIAATGELLPFQVFFIGKTKNVLPSSNEAIAARQDGWHLTFSSNHWSNLTCVKDWFDSIVRPYYAAKCKEKGLILGRQKIVVLMDCWSVHRSVDLRHWIKTCHPYVALLYVPAACTSKLQPCDIIVQRPLKAGFQREWHRWAINDAARRFRAGIVEPSYAFDQPISVLRNKAVEFLLTVHHELSGKTVLLEKGWEKPGLLRAWDANLDIDAAILEESVVVDVAVELEDPRDHFNAPWDAECDPDLVLSLCAGVEVLPVDTTDLDVAVGAEEMDITLQEAVPARGVTRLRALLQNARRRPGTE